MSFAGTTAVGTPTVRWSRLGNAGLCLLLSLMALGPLLGAYHAVTDGEHLLALHLALSGGVLYVMAVLLLVRGEALKRSTRRSEQITAIVGTFAAVPLGILPQTWHADWILELTSIGFIIAYCWIGWSLFTLRSALSVFPEARSLVTHGPYGLVRHPLYSVYILTYILMMIPRYSLLALTLTIIGIVAEVTRARNEERVLRAAFSEYEEYARNVRAFVPFKRRAA